MSKHIATLLAATAIAACSSDPRSIAEPTASATPLAQDFPAPELAPEPFEDAFAPPAPRASEPPYPHPGAPLPRYSQPSSCDVIVERTRNGVVLTAVADLDRSMSGDYSFVITKSGGGNSSDIEQGGPFRSDRSGPIELSESEISLERGASYRATLTLTSKGREVCRRIVRS